MTHDDTRPIEIDLPLKRVSFDAVYEKSVRHGHIAMLHIWPARTPLAARGCSRSSPAGRDVASAPVDRAQSRRNLGFQRFM